MPIVLEVNENPTVEISYSGIKLCISKRWNTSYLHINGHHPIPLTPGDVTALVEVMNEYVVRSHSEAYLN